MKELETRKVYTTGKYFGISKEKQIEIGEKIKEVLLEKMNPAEVEKWIAENFKDRGECFLAGFIMCYQMILLKMHEENTIRRELWNFLLGLKDDIIDPFASSYPIALIEEVVFRKDPHEAIKKSLKAYKEYYEKKKRFTPEVG